MTATAARAYPPPRWPTRDPPVRLRARTLRSVDLGRSSAGPVRHTFVHGPRSARRRWPLVARGVNDCEVARRLGVRADDGARLAPAAVLSPPSTCPRCWRHLRTDRLRDDDYAELLGLYLGDGHISHWRGRSGCGLPGLDASTRRSSTRRSALLRRCFRTTRSGARSPGRRHDGDPVRPQRASGMPAAAARGWQEARPHRSRSSRGSSARSAAPWAFPPRLHPLRRLRLRQPDGAATST